MHLVHPLLRVLTHIHILSMRSLHIVMDLDIALFPLLFFPSAFLRRPDDIILSAALERHSTSIYGLA
jgi:hypothetical protein